MIDFIKQFFCIEDRYKATQIMSIFEIIIVPSILLLYTLFYIHYPLPQIFDESAIYYFFPNMRDEYIYLQGKGLEGLGINFMHYRANIFFLFLFLNIVAYLIYFPIAFRRDELTYKIGWNNLGILGVIQGVVSIGLAVIVVYIFLKTFILTTIGMENKDEVIYVKTLILLIFIHIILWITIGQFTVDTEQNNVKNNSLISIFTGGILGPVYYITFLTILALLADGEFSNGSILISIFLLVYFMCRFFYDIFKWKKSNNETGKD